MATVNPTTEQLLPLGLVCRCPSGRRELPIRITPFLRHAVEAAAGNGELCLTHWCTDCGGLSLVRRKDIVRASA